MKSTIRRALLGLALTTVFQTSAATAADTAGMGEAEKEKIRLIVKEVLREYAASLNDKGDSGAADILREIAQSNRKFVAGHGPEYFKPFLEGQHPRATVITCSDSRVQTHALDGTPDGDLFVIRNIGNQIATAEGSVEYGVHHLHTPLLLVVGHVACGAIKAASGDYAKESPPIQRELDTIQIAKGDAGLNSVKQNVNNQVRMAMDKFEAEVMSGHLTVVGAVYDFRNEMKQGQGKLNLININGETDPAKLALLDLVKGMNAPPGKAGAARTPAKSESHKEGH